MATVSMIVAPLVGHWLGNSFFLCELFSHFPVQYAGLSGVLAAFWLGRGRWSLAGLSLLALLFNSWLCADLLLTTPPTYSNQAADFRVFHANVLYTRTDYRPIIDTIRRLKPDFFVLQEMTPEGVKALSGLKSTYPYQDSVWAKGPCYILVGSRTPFTVDSVARRVHRVISLTSRVRGKDVSLLTVHPRTPVLPSWFAQRNEQLRFVADQLAKANHPAVLIGDFNISPFSPVYKQVFLNQQQTDSPIEACRTQFGWTPTWPSFLPPLFIPIDHGFVNSGFRTVNFRTLSTPESDHRALCVDLVYADSRR